MVTIDGLSANAIGRCKDESVVSVTREMERLLALGPGWEFSTPVDMRARSEKRSGHVPEDDKRSRNRERGNKINDCRETNS
jgi:hypothetical protein